MTRLRKELTEPVTLPWWAYFTLLSFFPLGLITFIDNAIL